MNKKVLGAHGLMQQHPRERLAEGLAEQRACRDMDRLNDYLMRNWKDEMEEFGLEGVPLVMLLLDQTKEPVRVRQCRECGVFTDTTLRIIKRGHLCIKCLEKFYPATAKKLREERQWRSSLSV